MASSSSRAVRGIRFSEAPFIEPVVTAAHSSTSAEAENGQLAPNTSDCSPSNRDAQNAASGSNPEQRRQDGIQRSSFNPSASVWVPSASTQVSKRSPCRLFWLLLLLSSFSSSFLLLFFFFSSSFLLLFFFFFCPSFILLVLM
ncbi:hypothetical protein J3F84DRAFT_155600 [Trichoderma pleuroticola]